MSSVSSSHIKRYRDIAWLLWKHGRADWVESAGIDKHVKDEFRTEPEGPDALAKDLESLGPTFIKVGQMLASRADLLPPPYLAALARLQDDVEPIPFERIEEVINQELKARPSRAFASIDPTPLAAASLAQVHAATLRDGRHVVIKVQRPDIEDQIRVDFEAFATIARLGAHTTAGQRYRFEDMVEEFRRTIFEELDYRLEAQNLISLKRNLAEFELIHVPKPFIEFSSARVLTMERCDGASVADISPVIFTEVNGHVLADALFEAYLKQILVDGFFHADPHPGNVLLDQRHRLALIDLGMVGRIDQKLRQ
ncbi:MAG: ABC1 kinase family protein, partial [Phycisphaerae bacterium]